MNNYRQHEEKSPVLRAVSQVGLLGERSLFWACRDEPNFGDWISPYLFKKLTGRRPIYASRQSRRIGRYYFSTGSIIEKNWRPNSAIIWGSGVMFGDGRSIMSPKDIRAVRGPLSKRELDNQGYKCPEVFGDPGILLPTVYLPTVSEKKYRIGIIPHLVDHDECVHMAKSDDVCIIDLKLGVEAVVDKMVSCESVVSSSLHGAIVANAYRIPSLIAKIGDKIKGSGIKFDDYLLGIDESIDVNNFKTGRKSLEDWSAQLAEVPILDVRKQQRGLIDVCPYERLGK